MFVRVCMRAHTHGPSTGEVECRYVGGGERGPVERGGGGGMEGGGVPPSVTLKFAKDPTVHFYTSGAYSSIVATLVSKETYTSVKRDLHIRCLQ
jgi:hypothetical protein